jgi:hypothetical protein
VTIPALLSRVEERIQLAAGQAGEIRPFGPGALRAGLAKTFGIVRATMLLGNDMLDLEPQRASIVFVKVAVFAAMAGPLPNEGSNGGVHHSPELAARS